MRFVRCFVFDVREGWAALWRWYIATAVLFSLLALSLHLESAGRMEGTFTLGDYLVSYMAGMKSYFFSYEEPFRFPVAWGVLLMFAAYLTLWYPYHDLMGMGKQVMVSVGSRWSWWFAKCAWVVWSVGLFWAIGCVTAGAWTLLSGGSFSLDISDALPDILDFRRADVAPTTHGLDIFLFVGVPCALVALCLVQLATSLLLRPVISYAVTLSFPMVSLFYQNPWLIGNELMAARSMSLLLEGVPVMGGMVVSLTLSVVAIVAGGLMFSWIDVFDKEGYS